MSLTLCIVAFLVVAYGARKSLVGGVAATIAVGYSYGIVRANVQETMSHFIFDGAVIGLYFGWLLAVRRPGTVVNTQLLRPWLIVLIGWPALLTLLPIQDPMVQIVGLRGCVFLLPMLLLGAQLSDEDRSALAGPIAVLNIVALGFAALEFFIGLESFYPYSEVTELIYRSQTSDASASYRIPATFVTAHAYAGTMVCTLPLLVSRWTRSGANRLLRFVLVLGIAAAMVGVFISATRIHAIVLFLLVIVASLSLRMRPARLVVWLMVLSLAGWLVWQDARLQRFTTLSDTDFVASRLQGSFNSTLFSLIADYPMGNGIGGGGTSLPYFLANQVDNPIRIENEYGRILLELGVPGLVLWIAFVFWVLVRGARIAVEKTDVGRRLAWATTAAYLVSAVTGVGMLTSVPQSALLMLLIGWVVRADPVYAAGRTDVVTGAEVHSESGWAATIGSNRGTAR